MIVISVPSPAATASLLAGLLDGRDWLSRSTWKKDHGRTQGEGGRLQGKETDLRRRNQPGLGSRVACTGSKLPFPAGEREGFIQESSLEASGHQMEGQEKKGKLSAFSLVRALLPCEGNRLEPKHLTEISSYILT